VRREADEGGWEAASDAASRELGAGAAAAAALMWEAAAVVVLPPPFVSALRPSASDSDPFRTKGRRAAAAVAAVAVAEACCFWAKREAREVKLAVVVVEE
jgi:hypothetical protein